MAEMLKETRKQSAELEHFRLADRLLPGLFPHGDVQSGIPPAPDILVSHAGGTLGIEITQLFQLGSGGERLSVTSWEAAQRDICKEARRLYVVETGRDDLFVNVGFASVSPPAKLAAAKILKDFVRHHRPEENGEFKVSPTDEQAKKLLPDWLSGIVIFSTRADVQWLGGSVWETGTLTIERLQLAVDEKNVKVPKYLRGCDDVWLLVVCDVFPMAASYSVPRAASGWRLSSSFGKVLLVSRDGDAFEL